MDTRFLVQMLATRRSSVNKGNTRLKFRALRRFSWSLQQFTSRVTMNPAGSNTATYSGAVKFTNTPTTAQLESAVGGLRNC